MMTDKAAGASPPSWPWANCNWTQEQDWRLRSGLENFVSEALFRRRILHGKGKRAKGEWRRRKGL